jgi:hypothetical protein
MLPEDKKKMEDNLYKIQVAFYNYEIIGLCGVPVNRNIDIIQNRLNIVRLFQKLNQGGTILSGLELMRSVLKAYSADNELFLNDIKDKYADIGFNQDEIVKLIFLLQDNHNKDIIEIDQDDSDFINAKGDRIKKCLDGTRAFLKHAGLYEYVTSSRPSLIPLTFIAYHLFHLEIDDPSVYFENSETGNKDLIPIRTWLIISLLNHVFQRGNGWNPTTTGRRKILEVMKTNKNKVFPTELLYDVYKNHSLTKFYNNLNESWEWLNWYERSLVVYLLYGKPKNFRQNDIDHIHPKSILESRGIEWNKINLLGNFQYLYYSDNRSKQAVEFGEWLYDLFGENSNGENSKKLNEYIELHSIPNNKLLWKSDKFEEFLEARRELIFNKLKKQI